ncbi:MAG: NDP-sugar synthase [Aigarchaeota archaeon]|nr:NDP-sugar synthase [Candidatus Pelearchaeum maunauluense]
MALKAVVFAAGLGKRIRPLSDTRSKPLLPVAGRPVILMVLDALRHAGVREVGIIINYLSEKVMALVGERAKDLDIRFIHQEKTLGTGHALAAASEYLSDVREFLVVYGDITLTPEALERLIEFHRSGKYDGSLMGVRVDSGQRFGIIRASNNILERILEKAGESGPVNSGVYILPSETLDVVKSLKPSPRGEYELTDALNIMAESGRRIGVYVDSGDWWFDVGSPPSYLQANAYFLTRRLGSKVSLKRPCYMGKDTKLAGPCIIGEGTRIGSGSTVIGPSFIGDNVRIGANVVIESSIVLEDVVIDDGASLRSVIVGEGAHIGAGLRLNGAELPQMTIAPHTRLSSRI